MPKNQTHINQLARKLMELDTNLGYVQARNKVVATEPLPDFKDTASVDAFLQKALNSNAKSIKSTAIPRCPLCSNRLVQSDPDYSGSAVVQPLTIYCEQNPDHYSVEQHENCTLTRVEELKESDMVDLEDDLYADTGDNTFEFDFESVVGDPYEEPSTDPTLLNGTVVVVPFGFDGVGFPKGHLVNKVNIIAEEDTLEWKLAETFASHTRTAKVSNSDDVVKAFDDAELDKEIAFAKAAIDLEWPETVHWLDALLKEKEARSEKATSVCDTCEDCGQPLEADGTCTYAEMDEMEGVDHRTGEELSEAQIERNKRTDLCPECKPEDHTSCSMDPNCACCQTTIQALAEEVTAPPVGKVELSFEAYSLDDGDIFLFELANRGIIEMADYRADKYWTKGDTLTVLASQVTEIKDLPDALEVSVEVWEV